jgi:hypothetical protein
VVAVGGRCDRRPTGRQSNSFGPMAALGHGEARLGACADEASLLLGEARPLMWERAKGYQWITMGMFRFLLNIEKAVAAEIDVKRRRLGEQGRRMILHSGELPERYVMLEVACEP